MKREDLSRLSDEELRDSTAAACRREHEANIDVVWRLVEVARRKAYLNWACSSMTAYAKQLGFSEDQGRMRVRVARLALVIPQVLDELEQRRIHLTGLYLLSNYLTPKNAPKLLAAACGKSRREITELIAARYPKPDVPELVREIGDPAPPLPLPPPAPPLTLAPAPVEPGAGESLPEAARQKMEGVPPVDAITGTGPGGYDRIEPLSGKSYAIQFTASATLVRKLERLRELVSHAIPNGRLCLIVERAVDVAIAQQTKRLLGSDKPRKQRTPRKQKPNSRHVPVKVQRAVRERDQDRCTFVDSRGVRCAERCFLTVEHNDPWARTHETTPDNCCLLCAAHNLLRAKQVFGEEYIAKKIAESKLTAKRRKVESALRNSGYKPREAKQAAAAVSALASPEADLPTLLRAAFQLLGM